MSAEGRGKIRISKRFFLRVILPVALAVLVLAAGIITYFAGAPYYYGARRIVSASSPKSVSAESLSSEYVDSVRELGLKLLAESEFDSNNLYSPFSLSVAMSMLLAAAGHDESDIEKSSSTFLEIREALGFEEMALADIYKNNRTAIEKSYLSDPKVKFFTANSIWYNEDKDSIDLSKTFKDTLAEYFYADFFAQDFTDKRTVKNINKWVDDKTDGMIKEIIERIEPETVMIGLNSVFFDGEWETKFEKKSTAAGNFTTGSGTVAAADYMKSPATAAYKGTDKFSAVKIPYKGGKIFFLAVLPAEDMTVGDLVSDREAMALAMRPRWTYALSEEEDGIDEARIANYFLPKFKFEKEYDLVEILKSFGVRDAFIDGIADFSAAQNPDSVKSLYLDEAVQKAVIDLNEERTRAAAVTMWAPRGSSAPAEPVTVRFNRPFFFSIITEDGLPLFTGTIEKPVA